MGIRRDIARRLTTALRVAPLVTLGRQIGLRATLLTLVKMGAGALRGEPWRALAPPASSRERACRDQIGPAVVCYDILRAELGAERALSVLGELVCEAAVDELRRRVPVLSRARYEALDGDARAAMLRAALDRFPNTTIADLTVSDERFSYRVTRCELVELCRRLGRPELAPLFCRGDGLFFERYLPEVHFHRPGTLAEGAESCLFCFRWARNG